MKLPDTMEAALLLSVIDFFLCFIFIGAIGVILALFPWLNRLGEVKEEK